MITLIMFWTTVRRSSRGMAASVERSSSLPSPRRVSIRIVSPVSPVPSAPTICSNIVERAASPNGRKDSTIALTLFCQEMLFSPFKAFRFFCTQPLYWSTSLKPAAIRTRRFSCSPFSPSLGASADVVATRVARLFCH